MNWNGSLSSALDFDCMMYVIPQWREKLPRSKWFAFGENGSHPYEPQLFCFGSVILLRTPSDCTQLLVNISTMVSFCYFGWDHFSIYINSATSIHWLHCPTRLFALRAQVSLYCTAQCCICYSSTAFVVVPFDSCIESWQTNWRSLNRGRRVLRPSSYIMNLLAVTAFLIVLTNRVVSIEEKVLTSVTTISSSKPPIASPLSVQDTTSSFLPGVHVLVDKVQSSPPVDTTLLVAFYPHALELATENINISPNTESSQLTAWLYETSKERLPFSEWFEKKIWEKERLETL